MVPSQDKELEDVVPDKTAQISTGENSTYSVFHPPSHILAFKPSCKVLVTPRHTYHSSYVQRVVSIVWISWQETAQLRLRVIDQIMPCDKKTSWLAFCQGEFPARERSCQETMELGQGKGYLQTEFPKAFIGTPTSAFSIYPSMCITSSVQGAPDMGLD
ncbi:hypothetical protein BU16DRAFT_196273 [Lophium mytilinum]|uniref:Uncharacterized protein n=1 Tax=Lophium mytilinum TaxID=390894 RepID=A0A6A6RC75_9PEZI|nr:hypothetical protein BU16DRAFT_196273 [Lophium mytilinum]